MKDDDYGFIKTIAICIICIMLVSCKSTSKITYKECKASPINEYIFCSTITYESDKIQAGGFEFIKKPDELIYSSKSVTGQTTVMEQAGAAALLKIIDQVEIK